MTYACINIYALFHCASKISALLLYRMLKMDEMKSRVKLFIINAQTILFRSICRCGPGIRVWQWSVQEQLNKIWMTNAAERRSGSPELSSSSSDSEGSLVTISASWQKNFWQPSAASKLVVRNSMTPLHRGRAEQSNIRRQSSRINAAAGLLSAWPQNRTGLERVWVLH